LTKITESDCLLSMQVIKYDYDTNFSNNLSEVLERSNFMSFQTEYPFVLPRGFVDMNGEVHKEGIMRLANAGDEILPLRDSRVQQNPGYLTIILLARVIIKLGSLLAVDTNVVEKLYTMDIAYLQDLYQRINTIEMPTYKGACPHCGKELDIPINFLEAGI